MFRATIYGDNSTRKVLIQILRRTMTTAPENTNLILRGLFKEAVKAVQPARLIRNQVKFSNGHLSVNNQEFALSKPCYVVGFGKAVLEMATTVENILGNNLKRAIVTVPKGIFQNYPETTSNDKLTFIQGAENNIPDEAALEGSKQIKQLVETLKEDDLLIVLISGGGSALLPFPIPPITLHEKQEIIRGLGRAGATIGELNTVRKHLSVLKGGGLAKIAYPSRVLSLILSDIVGDPLHLIASGPTVYSLSTSQEAIDILKKYSLYESAPNSIKTVLEASQSNLISQSQNGRGERVEKSDHVVNFIIGTNTIATEAARDIATRIGWQCVVISHKVEGDVNFLANIYATLANYIQGGKFAKMQQLLENLPFELEDNAIENVLSLYSTRKILLIFAGEPTVVVSGSGKGGRNQQLALTFSMELNKQAAQTAYSGNISLLSAGTDGIDGPTDAAGAIGSSGLVDASLDLDPQSYLTNNDTYTFFNQYLNGELLVKIGHTGTNVMDLHFLVIEPSQYHNLTKYDLTD